MVNEPLSVYEVHLGSWRPGLSYRELAEQLPAYVTEMGFTHVEFLPVAEHPFGGSWGYQVTSYYAPTSRFGSPDDFRYLVDALHQAGIGVIIDWVPAHFPRDDWALARFDGTALYEHPDPRRGEHPDWGTLIFNYGRTEVRNFLVANALYWLEEFHIDGLRVDAVASMLYLDYSREAGQWAPNQYGGRENLEAVSFLQEVNATAYRRQPGIMMIAEESTAWPGVTRPVHLGGLGFGFKWNMGWMHDTLAYLAQDPVYRQYHHNEMTFSLVYAFSENYVLPLSHDEVVHGKGSLLGKMPGDDWQQVRRPARAAGLHVGPPRQATAVHGLGVRPGRRVVGGTRPGLVGAGRCRRLPRGVQQLVQRHERGLPVVPGAVEAGLRAGGLLLDRRQRRGREHAVVPAVRGGSCCGRAGRAAGAVRAHCWPGFFWGRWGLLGPLGLAGAAASSGAAGEPEVAEVPVAGSGSEGAVTLVCVANFSGGPHEDYKIGLPHGGRWIEVLNTDSAGYGGSGVGNLGAVEAVDEEWHGRPASATIRVPPLGVLWFAPESGS